MVVADAVIDDGGVEVAGVAAEDIRPTTDGRTVIAEETRTDVGRISWPGLEAVVPDAARTEAGIIAISAWRFALGCTGAGAVDVEDDVAIDVEVEDACGAEVVELAEEHDDREEVLLYP